jgi:hypothetical protein
MATAQIEERVAALEAEIAGLKAELARQREPAPRWWEEIGMFANDPIYEKAMKLGREYRRSLRPGAKKQAAKTHARPRHRSS